uniref:MYND-type domain-containing protein n=2 Tax=Tetranychus urticae TaxID=32264 RepID=T1K987_TETUR
MVQNNDLSSSSSSVTTVSSINRITTANQINTFWLVAIIFNATLAALFFLIFCYLCLKKSLQSRKVRLDSRHGDPLFTRKSFTAPNESNGQKQSSVYTIPMDKHLLSVNSTKQSSLNKFKMAGRLTGRLATSSPIQSNNTISTLDSFSESNPSSPARYDPPPKNLQGPFDNLRAPVDENAEKVVNFTGPAEAIHAAKSLYHNNIKLSPVNPIQAADNQVKSDFEMKKDQSSSVATNNHNKQDTIPINQYNSSPLPPSSLSLSSTSSTTISQITGETKKETVIESKDLIVDRVLNYEKPANSDCDKNENGLSDPANHQHPMKHKNKKALAVGRDLQNIGSRVVAKLRNDRKTSVSIQTSPTIWFGTVDLKSDPTIAWEPHPVYSEPFSPNHDSRAERKYFIYLVTDASPYFRKNCIGKISLPARSALTLSQLRDILMKAEDSSLKDVLKKNRSFRFLTETYRFVAQNEAIAPIDQVYPTQGIFIKLSAPDYSIMPTTDRSDTNHTTKVTGTGNRRRTYRDDAKFATFINISDTNPEKTAVKNQENFKQKRITFNQQAKREQPIHLYQDENNSEPVSTSDPRKRCARPTCNKPAIMGCGKCNNVFYCGIKCKNIHFSDHRSICSKPPWKF